MRERNSGICCIVGGVRTPFVKAQGQFKRYSLQDLGVHVLKELVSRCDLDPHRIDEFVFGSVLLDPRTPNWAREIVFAAGLPRSVYAHAVSNNCISGLVAITEVAERIGAGRTRCGIAGGSESMSNPTLTFRRSRAFLDIFTARSAGERLRAVMRLHPRDFLPAAPSVAEPSTGLTMGQHMEISAKEFRIPREEQDALALRSHQNAARATGDGRLTAELAPLGGVTADLLIRADTSAEKLARLNPVFDRAGTLTAGNSSPLTDGASAVLLMSEERAREEGREILGRIVDYEYAAIDPKEGLLMAPGVAVPRLLRRRGLAFRDFDLIEVHEAFAAQVLANLKVWEEGWKEPGFGPIDRSGLNVLGGSIAIGHPFAATAGRMLTSLVHELKRRNGRRGLISICAAGAMAGAMVVERG